MKEKHADVVILKAPLGLFAHCFWHTCILQDRLPTPFGLVRSGVSPDHQDTKVCTHVSLSCDCEGLRFRLSYSNTCDERKTKAHFIVPPCQGPLADCVHYFTSTELPAAPPHTECDQPVHRARPRPKGHLFWECGVGQGREPAGAALLVQRGEPYCVVLQRIAKLRVCRSLALPLPS